MSRRNKQKRDDFVLDIEENALSSLTHGIEHFCASNDIKNLKFCILHIFHAVELYLKARLAKDHPLLIYLKPEKPLDDTSHTINFESLIGRLRNIGVSFSEEDVEDLKHLKKTRNSIEHNKYAGNKEDVRHYIGRAMRIFEHFLRDELDIELSNVLDEKIYYELKEALYSYEELLDMAKDEIEKCLPFSQKDRLEYEFVLCPECYNETILNPDPKSDDEMIHCFLCQNKFYQKHCPRCNGTILSYEPVIEENDPIFCDDCWEHQMSED